MKNIIVTGAGGGGGIAFSRSLRASGEKFNIIGVDCDKYKLHRAVVDQKILVPRSDENDYIGVLIEIIKNLDIDFLQVQTTAELFSISANRERLGCKTFLPSHETILACADKFETYNIWNNLGITVPQNVLIDTEDDLKGAFASLGSAIWLRPRSGTGAWGAIGVENYDKAKEWIDNHNGWGKYLAAEHLEKSTCTFESIWNKGELILAQQRKRLYWELASYSASGVTGNTGAGITIDDPIVTSISIKSILAVDPKPNGAFGVDFTYDKAGTPNPTEINVGRLMSTHDFFTASGVNLAYTLLLCAFNEKLPEFEKRINPLKSGLVWIRGMDVQPILMDFSDIEAEEQRLIQRRKKSNV